MNENPVSILLFIRIFEPYDLIGKFQHLAFQPLITPEHIHQHISVVLRRSETEHRRMGGVELRIVLIQPNGSFYRRTFIGSRKKNRFFFGCHLFSIFIFHRHPEHVLPRRDSFPVKFHFLVGSKYTRKHRLLFYAFRFGIFRTEQSIRAFHRHRHTVQIFHFAGETDGHILAGSLLQRRPYEQRPVARYQHLCTDCVSPA